mmetsp:Transcript_31306/g.86039  ORF Transcript_31306/g.86039 Transcript_31306/m.86039 type:complete len:240 (-) Transcript_31306:432-1151(-)
MEIAGARTREHERHLVRGPAVRRQHRDLDEIRASERTPAELSLQSHEAAASHVARREHHLIRDGDAWIEAKTHCGQVYRPRGLELRGGTDVTFWRNAQRHKRRRDVRWGCEALLPAPRWARLRRETQVARRAKAIRQHRDSHASVAILPSVVLLGHRADKDSPADDEAATQEATMWRSPRGEAPLTGAKCWRLQLEPLPIVEAHLERQTVDKRARLQVHGMTELRLRRHPMVRLVRILR